MDESLADAGALGHVVHRQGVRAARDEFLERGIEDPPGGLRAGRAPVFIHLAASHKLSA